MRKNCASQSPQIEALESRLLLHSNLAASTALISHLNSESTGQASVVARSNYPTTDQLSFALKDINPNSNTYGQTIGTSMNEGEVAAYYFTSAG